MKNALIAMSQSGGRRGKSIATTWGVSHSSLKNSFYASAEKKDQVALKRGPPPDLPKQVETLLKSFVVCMHSMNLAMNCFQVREIAFKITAVCKLDSF